MTYVYGFDTSGNITQKKVLDKKGKPYLSCKYSYDKEGKLKKKGTQFEDSQDKETSERYIYDQEGKLIRIEKSIGGIPSVIIEYEYDAFGKIEAEIGKTDGETKTECLLLYVYNDNGQISSIFGNGVNDETGVEKKFSYDKTGNLQRVDVWVSTDDGMILISVKDYSYEYW